MFFVRTLVLPLDSVAFHYSGKLFFFGLHPLIPFGIPTRATLKSLRRKRLFQRYTGIQSTLAADGKGNKINMQMRRCFVHMQMS